MTPRPVPTVESAPFWEALREHRLSLPWCGACARLHHPSAIRCPSCRGVLAWQDVEATGTVDTWTVVGRSFTPGFDPPYVVARVSLDAQPDVVLDSAMTAVPPRIGAPVRATYLDDSRGFTIPVFQTI